MEVSDTDRAILIALCRPYIESRKFPLPATDQQIREELGQQDIDLDDEALRQRLRELFTEFGADGVAPGQRRNELVERVYASGVLAPWGPGEVPARRWHERLRTRAGKIGAPRLAAGAGAVAVLVVVAALVVPKPAPGTGLIDAAAGADIGNIDPGLADTAAGTVRYCTGDDVANGQHKTAVRDFNQTYGPYRQGRAQRARPVGRSGLRAIQQLAARSVGCVRRPLLRRHVDGGLRSPGWLHELSSYIAPNKAQYVPPMLQAATVEERQWGVPKQADAGLLFYRKDLVDDPPCSWQDLYRDAAAGRGKLLRYQGRAYEGLTVNFLEMAYAAGAKDIVTPAGKANLNQQAEQDALNLMIAGIQRHAAPREVVLQQEEHNIRAFAKGKAIYMRNWPHAYARVLKCNPRLKGKIGVARLPGVEGRRVCERARRPHRRDLRVLEEPRGGAEARRLPDVELDHRARRGPVRARARAHGALGRPSGSEGAACLPGAEGRGLRRQAAPVGERLPELLERHLHEHQPSAYPGDLAGRRARRCRRPHPADPRRGPLSSGGTLVSPRPGARRRPRPDGRPPRAGSRAPRRTSLAADSPDRLKP